MKHQPQKNHGQTQKEQGDNTAATAARKLLIADIRATFGTDHGKRVWHFIQSSAGCVPGQQRPAFQRTILSPSASDGISQSIAAAAADGRKSLYYELEELYLVPEEAAEQAPAAIR